MKDQINKLQHDLEEIDRSKSKMSTLFSGGDKFKEDTGRSVESAYEKETKNQRKLENDKRRNVYKNSHKHAHIHIHTHRHTHHHIDLGKKKDENDNRKKGKNKKKKQTFTETHTFTHTITHTTTDWKKK